MNTATKKLSLTAMISYDENLGVFSGYFAEYPEAIGQGKTEEDVLKDLIISFKQVFLLKQHLATKNAKSERRVNVSLHDALCA